MQNSQHPDSAIEWSLLQNQFDSYEKFSLLIKLTAVAVLTGGLIANTTSVFMACLLAVLWLQDAIWKTFQARIENRLLQLESLIANTTQADTSTQSPYQYNSEYLKNRGGQLMLIVEYLQQAFRPTVAFPHIVLLGVCVAARFS